MISVIGIRYFISWTLTFHETQVSPTSGSPFCNSFYLPVDDMVVGEIDSWERLCHRSVSCPFLAPLAYRTPYNPPKLFQSYCITVGTVVLPHVLITSCFEMVKHFRRVSCHLVLLSIPLRTACKLAWSARSAPSHALAFWDTKTHIFTSTNC